MNVLGDKYVFGKGIEAWKGGLAFDLTFVVTKDCNLRCKYCYITHKSDDEKMSIEIAKQTIDYVLDNPQIFKQEAIVLNFIGGEPLMEIELIDQICDYFKVEAYKKHHVWFENYRICMATNGILYAEEEVQLFIKKNLEKLSIGITIDGTKEKHDLQRIYIDGRGSYEDVVKNIPLWLKQFPGFSTKVTFSQSDLPLLKDSIIHLWQLGIKEYPANVVFEDVWEEGDDVIFEQQLKALADYVIENDLWKEYNCTLFDENMGYPYSDVSKEKNFCGAGTMLSVDAKGTFFPCIRFMGYSLNNKAEYEVGNIYNGINLEKIRPFQALDVSLQSKQECIDCEVASGCAWCQGYNYDVAESDTIYQRAISICKMHKARCRANNYYWDKLYKKHKINRESNWENRQHLYLIMSDDCIENCTYTSSKISNISMNRNIVKKAIEFMNKNFYKPVLLHSKNIENLDYLDLFQNNKVDILSADLDGSIKSNNKIVVYTKDTIDVETSTSNCIFNIKSEDISLLAKLTDKLFHKATRINLNLILETNLFDYKLYENQLNQIIEQLILYFQRGEKREINIITDRLFLNKMENCNFGVYNYALAPNGKFYICPAFYFNDPETSIGSLEDGISIKNAHLLKLEYSPICSSCDAYHCSRCLHLNKKLTSQTNTPSSLQCKISHLEREASRKFIDRLSILNSEYKDICIIEEIDYSDPLEKIKENKSVILYGKQC